MKQRQFSANQKFRATRSKKNFVSNILVNTHWNRVKGAIRERKWTSWDGVNTQSKGYHYDPQIKDSWNPSVEQVFTWFFDADAVAKATEIDKKIKAAVHRRDSNRQYAWDANNRMREHVRFKREEAAKQAYLDNFGDPLNWESYMDRADIKRLDRETFHDLLSAVDAAINSGKLSRSKLTDLTCDQLLDHINAGRTKPVVVDWPPEIDPRTFIPYPQEVSA